MTEKLKMSRTSLKNTKKSTQGTTSQQPHFGKIMEQVLHEHSFGHVKEKKECMELPKINHT